MNKNRPPFFLLIYIILVTNFQQGCIWIYGLKKFQKKSSLDLFEYSQKLALKNSCTHFCDDTNFQNLNSSGKFSNSLYKTLNQPIQIFIFDSLMQLNYFIANCDIGGFPNLRWKKKLNDPIFLSQHETSDLSLSGFLELYNLNQNSNCNSRMHNLTQNTIVIRWSYFMGRQNKRLFKCIKKTKWLNNYYRILINIGY